MNNINDIVTRSIICHYLKWHVESDWGGTVDYNCI